MEKDARIKPVKRPLNAVYINTGENGVFSAGEFEAITTTGQMEFVTPEEIAHNVKEELLGGNTGYEVIGMLSNTVMKSTYRAGVMRDHAIRRLRRLQEKYDDDSVAFEILGPPRLSKLLYEAHLLKLGFRDIKGVLRATPESLSRKLTETIRKNRDLRARAVSIGIPILLPDGKSMLRGPNVAVPPFRGLDVVPLKAVDIDRFAYDGWIDLRVKNMRLWKSRLRALDAEIRSMAVTGPKSREANTSSRAHRKRYEIEQKGAPC
ncbi:MAG: hypothetical protein M5R36_27505 [Deltaproteobacteria bacterium]|nr:hypothetical protein [Deltaproteobacteria bacterium]